MTSTRTARTARVALGLAAAGTLALGITATTVDTAEAKPRYGEYAAAGVIGLAAGALIGSAIASQPRNVIIYERPVYGGLAPWTPEWYRYCSARYRSFNPNTGYFVGYDRRHHFCR